ncbi:hypothetical protein [Azohydromonas aeria]|uniref:hypothetical protein n=1 Tax=Azohydromonas aeria TaxID=2590212 RepID=UPI0012FA5FFA|nr:hypothetical protein [Azohydromonas aeria]
MDQIVTARGADIDKAATNVSRLFLFGYFLSGSMLPARTREQADEIKKPEIIVLSFSRLQQPIHLRMSTKIKMPGPARHLFCL